MAEEYLEHYGVLGMHWGIRKDGGPQGYPGTYTKGGGRRGNRSSSESSGGRRGHELSAEPRGKTVKRTAAAAKQAPKSQNQNGQKVLEKAQSFVESQYGSDAEEAALVTLATVLALAPAAIPLIAVATQNHTYKKMRKNEQKGNNIKSEKDVKKLSKKETSEESMKAVNPKFKDGFEYQRNCMLCTTAYDLRQRGYDVQAKPRKIGGKIEEVTSWYKDAKVVNAQGSRQLESKLKKLPNGSRGNLMMMGPFGGHSIAFEIKNGKPVYIDAQANRTWTIEEMEQIWTEFNIIRTDNCEVNWETIGEGVFSPGQEDSVKRK